MKREFVKNLLKELHLESATEKAIVDAIMDENGKDVTEANDKVKTLEGEKTTLTTERDDLKSQIETRDKDIADLQEKVKDNESLSQQLSDLQTKYQTDTQELNDKLSSQARKHATDKFFEGYQFTSTLAKEAAVSAFEKKNFKFEEGKFLGAEDFMKTLREENPTAFVEEDNGGDPPPKFSDKTNGGGGDAPVFDFNFSGVRARPAEK